MFLKSVSWWASPRVFFWGFKKRKTGKRDGERGVDEMKELRLVERTNVRCASSLSRLQP